MLVHPRSTSLSAAWQPVGPLQIGSLAYGNVTGRIASIAIDPDDSTGNTVYIGTTGGGVWKSENAAGPTASVSFAPLTDTLPVFSPSTGSFAIASLSIGAVSVGDGVVLAGTGDPNDALDSYYGSGILRSIDGGTTWSLRQESNDGVYGVHSFVGLGFAGFAWSSTSPDTVVAAVSDAIEGEIVNAADAVYSVRGLYYSTDAGMTWQMATILDGPNDASHTVQAPQPSGGNLGGNAATSVVWNPLRQRFYAAVRYHGYYESSDGAVWTRLAAQPGTGLTAAACPTSPGTTGSANCPIFRGTLAVQPVSGDTFAFTVDASNLDQGIWQDPCSVANSACTAADAFSSRLDSVPLEDGGGSTAVFQGDYNLSLAVVASGSDTLLFAGTVDLFRCSIAAGCAFRNTTNVDDGCAAPSLVAPAQHAIATLANGSAPLLYLGNDGGLWRSVDGVNQQQRPCSHDDATHFQNLNGGIGSLAEVVDFAQHPSDANTLLVGVGANGTAATSTASSNQPWQQLAAGEGGFTAIDPANPANWYASTAPGVSITYCGKGAACAAADFAGLPTIGPAQVADDDSLIDPPWLLDPALSSDVAIGTCRVWRGPAASGSAWNSAGTTANALSENFGGPQNASCGDTNPLVRSLAAGGPASSASVAPHAGSEVLYAGLAGSLDGGGNLGGHIFSTGAGNTAGPSTAWTDLALSPVTNVSSNGGAFNPGGFDVSSIAVDPHDPTGSTVYATVMGFAGNAIPAPHVYRSLDAGAHWTNISSNLPNAPANAVVVDPNDANTLYVAMDTGVYTTRQVATCTTANCWDVYGVDLPNSPIVQLAASAALPAGGGSNGILRAATYGRGIWQIPLLTATQPLNPLTTLAPASLSFSIQPTGSASPAQPITVKNTGDAALSVTSVTATGDFSETDNCAGSSIAIGASCSVQVEFLPAAAGTRTGVLTVYGNVPGGQATAALTGLGAPPAAVVLNPLNLNFGAATLGATTAAQNITISNTGGVAATLQPPSITGDFQMTANTCGTILPSQVGCTVAIIFAPTASGIRNGTLTVADSTGTQTASLTGSGVLQPTDALSPLSLNFGTQQAFLASPTQKVTLVNSGDSLLTLVDAQITNGDFTVVSGCGASLSGHSSCVLEVAFVPTVNGPETGTLTVSDQLRSQTVALSGIGVAPPKIALAPTSLSFSATPLSQSSAALSVSVSNSGGGQLTITGVSVSGVFTESDNCTGKSLSGSASCAVQVVFSPSSAGTLTGTLTVSANSGTGTATQQATVALSGTGAAPAAIVLTPTALSFGTVTLGSSSAPPQNITISNTGGVPASLQTITITGDFAISANTCGLSLPASTGCTIAVIFTPTASGTRTGTVSVTDSVGTQTATLTGGGASVATDGLAPLSLAFGTQQLNTASTPQQVMLTNTGDNALTLIGPQIANGPFTVVNACGPILAGHSSCALAVTAVPKSIGPATGALSVADQFRTQTVSLSVTGVAPPGVSLSPTNGLTFAATGVTVTSPPQTVTLSNNGGVALAISGIVLTGDFSVLASTNTCAAPVAPGSACTFQVVFAPSIGGPGTGTLTISDNAPTSPQTLPLQGTGIDFSLVPDGSTSVTVSSGTSAVYPLLLSSASNIPGSAAMSCSGAPTNATCLVIPANPTLGSTQVVTVTVATGVSASASLHPRPNTAWGILLPIAVPLSFFAWGRRKLNFGRDERKRSLRSINLFAPAIILVGLLLAAGCGSGRLIPPPETTPTSPTNPTPTPTGTYPIVVSATSAGLTRSVNLTLVVQ